MVRNAIERLQQATGIRSCLILVYYFILIFLQRVFAIAPQRSHSIVSLYFRSSLTVASLRFRSSLQPLHSIVRRCYSVFCVIVPLLSTITQNPPHLHFAPAYGRGWRSQKTTSYVGLLFCALTICPHSSVVLLAYWHPRPCACGRRCTRLLASSVSHLKKYSCCLHFIYFAPPPSSQTS